MKIYELLEYVDELQENCFSDQVKLRWINQIEAEIQTEVLLLAIDGIRQYQISDREAELLVPPPYDQIYQEYLFYQIFLAQGETERANNQAEVFNRILTDYQRFVCQTINPGRGLAERMGYYITAYQIAVKYGYTGTEEQWIKEVAGPPGQPGRDGKDGRDGTDGQDGTDGGYYTLSITQPDANTMRLNFTPSDSSMPAIQPVDVTLPAGPKGEAGNGFAILGYYDTLALLEAAKPTPDPGDAYGVGTEAPYDIYIWDADNQVWVNNGTIQGAQGLPGTDGQDGTDGGYYTPSITQPDANTMRISFTPSDVSMPALEDVVVTLPAGPAGSGDMEADAYDPDGTVAAAGGIAAYISSLYDDAEVTSY